MEGPDDRVLVDPEDLAQIDSWWQSLSRTDLALRDRSSNFGGHLVVEGHLSFAVNVDKIHNTSYGSTTCVIESRPEANEGGNEESPIDQRELELLIKEAKRLHRRRWSIVGVIAAAVVAAIALTVAQVSHSTPASLHSLLLKTSDLPGGWNIKHATTRAPYRGTSPETVSSLLGSNGVGVTFERSGGSPILFAYLTRSASVVDAFENAYKPIMTFGSCTGTAYGKLVDSSANDGVFSATSYGDWSIASKVTNVVHGVKSQLGYLLVRKGNYLMIMGYENKGSLDKLSLENLTQLALAKLNA